MAGSSGAVERFLGKQFLECKLNLFLSPLQSIADQGNNGERPAVKGEMNSACTLKIFQRITQYSILIHSDIAI